MFKAFNCEKCAHGTCDDVKGGMTCSLNMEYTKRNCKIMFDPDLSQRGKLWFEKDKNKKKEWDEKLAKIEALEKGE